MLNFCIFLSALGMLGADIFLFVIAKGEYALAYIFLVLGIVLLLSSLLSFKLRKSVHLLGFYLLLMFSVFFFQLIATILLMTSKDTLIEAIVKHSNFNEHDLIELRNKLNENVNSIFIAMMIFSVILVSINFIEINPLHLIHSYALSYLE